MSTRALRPIVTFYALFDLGQAAQVQDARTDLLTLHRKLGGMLELGVNANDAGTRAIVKISFPTEFLAQAQDWFATKPWRVAVLQVRREDAIDDVRALVTAPTWRAPFDFLGL